MYRASWLLLHEASQEEMKIKNKHTKEHFMIESMMIYV